MRRRNTTACESPGKAWEILLIDDGSMIARRSDGWRVPEADSHIIFYFTNRNYGQHAAIAAGL